MRRLARLILRLLVMLFALPHLLYGGGVLALSLFGLAAKLLGEKGSPWSFAGQDIARGGPQTEREVWAHIVLGTLGSLPLLLYGLVLLVAPWISWGGRPRGRFVVTTLAVVCSFVGVSLWGWLLSNVSEPERNEFLGLGGLVVALYLIGNALAVYGLTRPRIAASEQGG